MKQQFSVTITVTITAEMANFSGAVADVESMK